MGGRLGGAQEVDPQETARLQGHGASPDAQPAVGLLVVDEAGDLEQGDGELIVILAADPGGELLPAKEVVGVLGQVHQAQGGAGAPDLERPDQMVSGSNGGEDDVAGPGRGDAQVLAPQAREFVQVLGDHDIQSDGAGAAAPQVIDDFGQLGAGEGQGLGERRQGVLVEADDDDVGLAGTPPPRDETAVLTPFLQPAEEGQECDEPGEHPAGEADQGAPPDRRSQRADPGHRGSSPEASAPGTGERGQAPLRGHPEELQQAVISRLGGLRIGQVDEVQPPDRRLDRLGIHRLQDDRDEPALLGVRVGVDRQRRLQRDPLAPDGLGREDQDDMAAAPDAPLDPLVAGFPRFDGVLVEEDAEPQGPPLVDGLADPRLLALVMADEDVPVGFRLLGGPHDDASGMFTRPPEVVRLPSWA